MSAGSGIFPGTRERALLTTFAGSPAIGPAVPEGPSTMDAATLAERRREGGGAPSQQRPLRADPRGTETRGGLYAIRTAARALFAWRFRANHV